MKASVYFLFYFPLAQSAVVRPAAHIQLVGCLFQGGSLLSVDLLHKLEGMDLRAGCRSQRMLTNQDQAPNSRPAPSPS